MDLQEAKVVGLREVDHLGKADLGVDILQKDLEEEGQVVDHHQKDQGLEGKEEGKKRGKEDEEFELSLLYMK